MSCIPCRLPVCMMPGSWNVRSSRIRLPMAELFTRISTATADGYGIHVLRMDEPGPGWIEAEELIESDELKTALFARVSGLSDISIFWS